MRGRSLVVAALLASPVLAEETSNPPVEAAATPYVGGRYQVHGTITIQDTGERRAIGGMWIIDQQGDEYRSTYSLVTRIRNVDGDLVRADVIGRGEGRVQAGRFDGTAESQLILASVGGAYGATPYLPRRYGPILRQATRGTIGEEGELRVELDYEPVEGGPRERSHVVLRGQLVSE
jgi:hypothetical protein